jgi:hypothetical protein
MILVPPDWSYGSCWLVSHEVAHQWWYGDVGSDALAEPWVDEAPASWSARDVCDGIHEPGWSLHTRGPPRDRPPSATAARIGPDAWSLVYANGAAYFAALDEVDSEKLDAALARWHADHRWAFASGAALRERLADALGTEAEARAWAAWME